MHKRKEVTVPVSVSKRNNSLSSLKQMEEAKGKRTCILILGMHRSGTSALTRVINHLGADIPMFLLPENDDNPTGFWESREICQLNDEILQSCGTSWEDWQQFSLTRLHSSTHNGLVLRGIEILTQHVKNSSFFVFKDPRFCRLFPFWIDVLRKLDIDTKCILLFRNPLEVAASLTKRNNFSCEHALLLWLRYVLDAEHFSRNIPRALTTYSDLLSNWKKSVHSIAHTLDLEWPVQPSTITEKIDHFLQTGNQHHVFSDADISQQGDVGQWVNEIYFALKELQNDPTAQSAYDTFDSIRSLFNRASDVFGPIIERNEQLLMQQQTQITQHLEKGRQQEKSIEESKVKNNELEHEIAERGVQLNESKHEIAERGVQLNESKHEIAERDATLTAIQSTLTSVQQEKNDLLHLKNQLLFRLNTIQTNASWQLSSLSRFVEYRWPSLVRGIVGLAKITWWALSFRLPSRLRLRRQIRRVLAAGLFDVRWYIVQNPDIVLHGANPILHWFVTGWKEGRQPNPVFDVTWYLSQNQDVDTAGINPLIHYFFHGAREGRNPSPEFDTVHYMKEHPELAHQNINPLAHYLNSPGSSGWHRQQGRVQAVNKSPEPTQEPVISIGTFKQLYDIHFRGIQPIPAMRAEQEEHRINLVTDSIEQHSLLGGVATALIIASTMARKLDIELRIITRTTAVNSCEYYNNMKKLGVETPPKVTFYTDYDRDEHGMKVHKLELSKSDIFIATSWWSATAIKKTTIRKPFFYIIQEVETFFYPHGDEHLLSREILQDKNIRFVINSGWLSKYFEQNHPEVYKNGCTFEPAFPDHLYKARDSFDKGHQKYKLFFYSRPNNPRNLFYFGLKVIDRCILEGIINTHEWDIILVGSGVPDFLFCDGSKPQLLGLLDWQNYSNLLQTIDLGISLMYTPHPSYPPLDIAASGGVVVTNKCWNKTDISWSKNIIMSELNIESLTKNIKKGIELASNTQKREINFKNSTIPHSWSKNISNAIDWMCGEI